MKSFSKNLSFGVDFKLQVPPLMYKINTHNLSGVRSKAVILNEGLKSAEISAKTLRANKLAKKNFSKICRSESSLNCRSRYLYIKLKHTQHQRFEKLGRNPDSRVVLINWVCMYVCVYRGYSLEFFLDIEGVFNSIPYVANPFWSNG